MKSLFSHLVGGESILDHDFVVDDAVRLRSGHHGFDGRHDVTRNFDDGDLDRTQITELVRRKALLIHLLQCTHRL